MMKNIYTIAVLILSVSFLSSCQKEQLSETSVITTSTTTKNEFDKWLDKHFVDTYNIRFLYRFEEIESDYNYYNVPADYDCSVQMAHILRHVCLEAYDEIAGADFTRNYFPKMISCSGEWHYKNNGTMELASAEGGRKINLQGLNHLPSMMTPSNLNTFYLKTIHHEFGHILNQIKSYPTSFQSITGEYYVGGVWSDSPYGYPNYYLAHGFVTNYSQQEHAEDFVEVLSVYLTSSQEEWQILLEKATAATEAYNENNGTTLTDAAEIINAKLDVVRKYMDESWDIDIDKLQRIIQRRQNEIFSGNVDLNDLTE